MDRAWNCAVAMLLGLLVGQLPAAAEVNPTSSSQTALTENHLPAIRVPWELSARYDAGDSSSQTLTTKAWEALKRGDRDGVAFYTALCIDLYEPEALRQQASLRRPAPQSDVFHYWALNDVAVCYFILGESLRLSRQPEQARPLFERIVSQFSFAQCWDPRGWFWSVADGADVRLKILSAAP